ncbi:hypothetical protein HW509_14000 [Asaia spathodeae]|uniref:hypothetical protein n=1 Tax=Asaia spathodeae TaxID=657016 RepID=UPI002FC30242
MAGAGSKEKEEAVSSPKLAGLVCRIAVLRVDGLFSAACAVFRPILARTVRTRQARKEAFLFPVQVEFQQEPELLPASNTVSIREKGMQP